MISIGIKKCRSCYSKNIVSILSLGNQYLSDFRDDNEKPPQYPLDLVVCTECTLVQLRETTPQELLYTENYGYKSGINDTIRADLKDIAEKAKKFHEKGIVVDIGANDGTLLSNYGEEYYKIAYEPIKKLAKECENHANIVINDFFSAKAYPQDAEKAKIITVISCFYDLEKPNDFVADLEKILAPDGVLIIEQNYLGDMVNNTAFDNIVHEHIEYYSLKSLEHLLNRHGLKVFNVEMSLINGGAFRVYVKHMNNVEKLRIYEESIKLGNKWTYMLFALKVRNISVKVHDFITKRVAEGKTVYLYGASTRGNSLIQACRLDNKLITAAVERNPEKWGKKLASLDIPIISEDQAREEKPDYMLVLPWFFKKEFLKREKAYLDGGGHFIFPLPEFEVI